MAKPNTAAVCELLAEPIAARLGLYLWDVRFEKEGSGWFLRYYIDKDGGVDINDCESFSRAIDVILDECDPVEQSYCLEVSSPGIERELTKPSHFERYVGSEILIKLFRPKNSLKELKGILISHIDGITTIKCEDNEISVGKNEAALIRLVDNYDYKKENVDD